MKFDIEFAYQIEISEPPIDSRIPSYWIPAFLEAWDAGVPVIDATFQANARVRDYFSSELRDCIAMGVYGDPLRAKAR
jgi:hypothetical protein